MLSPKVLALPGPFSHEYVHTHGTRLHVASAGDQRAPLALLLHDALGGWFDYQFLIPELAPHFHVVAVSTRGFGMSDKPPAGYSIRHATGDISGLVRALGHGSAVVVGAGTAARLSTTLAANYPARVSRLVLIDPITSRMPLTARSRIMQARLSSRYPDFIAKGSLPELTADSEAGNTTQELRALSYKIAGTHGPRVRHAKLGISPLPVNWVSEYQQPKIELHGFPHILSPAQCAEALAI